MVWQNSLLMKIGWVWAQFLRSFAQTDARNAAGNREKSLCHLLLELSGASLHAEIPKIMRGAGSNEMLLLAPLSWGDEVLLIEKGMAKTDIRIQAYGMRSIDVAHEMLSRVLTMRNLGMVVMVCGIGYLPSEACLKGAEKVVKSGAWQERIFALFDRLAQLKANGHLTLIVYDHKPVLGEKNSAYLKRLFYADNP